MTSNRLSYASSPESDLELSPGPSTSLSLGNLPQLVKSSSDPSIATNQDNLDRDRDIIGEGLPPPYTVRGKNKTTTTIIQNIITLLVTFRKNKHVFEYLTLNLKKRKTLTVLKSWL